MLEGIKKVAIVGCGSCAASCKTGGEKEIAEMKRFLEENGMEVVATVLRAFCGAPRKRLPKRSWIKPPPLSRRC